MSPGGEGFFLRGFVFNNDRGFSEVGFGVVEVYMTKEQMEASKRLAHEGSYGPINRNTNSYDPLKALLFEKGFKAAHKPEHLAKLTPEQLLHNPRVRSLLETLKCAQFALGQREEEFKSSDLEGEE